MADLNKFAINIQASVELLRSAIGSPKDQLRLIPGIYNGLTNYSSATAALIRQNLLTSLARTVTGVDFQSRTEAEQALATLIPLFDAELAISTNAVVYGALRDLKAKLINDINQRGLRLPELINKQYKRALPSYVIAHDLYLDPSRMDEITTRNDPVHPLFCKLNLEVLSS